MRAKQHRRMNAIFVNDIGEIFIGIIVMHKWRKVEQLLLSSL